MRITLRPANERGHANHGWLDSYHSFSFGDYHDPRHMGFGNLRVINDDIIHGGGGFDTHGHRDMEIITYVLEGQLAHKDSTGSAGVLKPGDVQVMSAGTGIRHSEVNGSQSQDVHLLQIWILPDREAVVPFYQQHFISAAEKRNQLCLIAGPEKQQAAPVIHQKAWVYASLLDQGHILTHSLAKGRSAWVQLISGMLEVNGTALHPGDGAAIEDTIEVRLTAQQDAEFLLFDL